MKKFNEGSGPLAARCMRNLRPSQRNKILMTRSVDHSIQGENGQGNSIFGSKAGMVTTRMHLNNNTTLELIDTVNAS